MSDSGVRAPAPTYTTPPGMRLIKPGDAQHNKAPTFASLPEYQVSPQTLTLTLALAVTPQP
eukprot:278368-Pyramimonas_sp.AAC.2